MQEQRRRTSADCVWAELGLELASRRGEALGVQCLGSRVVEMQELPVGSIFDRVELPTRGDDRQRGLLESPQIAPEHVVGGI
jgi:hypothetical protein